MPKYFGVLGFSHTETDSSGVAVEVITEREYYGDIISVSKRYQSSDRLNDNINISNKISVIADPYLNDNLINLRYVKYLGTAWKVSEISVEFPRLVIGFGDVYN